MKKVVLAVVLVLLLGGGAGGYLVFFGDAARKSAAPKPAPPPEYMKLERFVVPIIRQGSVDGYSRLEVTLEITDFETRKEIERIVPRLRDAIQSDLYAYLPLRRAGGVGATADVEGMRKRIHAVVDKQVGPGKVTGILLEEIMDVAPKSAQPGG
jgi:flagellar basal body-associated protein FliL